MNILIAGGRGFLGTALTDELLKINNVQITHLSRMHDKQLSTNTKNITVITYEMLKPSLHFDVIINLAGFGVIDKAWSDKHKQYLLDSRLIPTQQLLDFIHHSQTKPKLFINGSAIGWYGVQADDDTSLLDENSQHLSNDFAHHLCDKWEKLANTCPIPTVIIRTGIVLAEHGGMLARLLPSFKMGLGGRLGDGEQMMSWISLSDWVRAVIFMMDTQLKANHTAAKQIYNLTAPNAVSNKDFTQTVSRWLNKPAFCHLPSFFVRLLFGERSILLLQGQRVYPKALLDNGFRFLHPRLSDLLAPKQV